ncbi:MAG: DUF4846 domain-containing protein [Bacteroidota bacterium]
MKVSIFSCCVFHLLLLGSFLSACGQASSSAAADSTDFADTVAIPTVAWQAIAEEGLTLRSRIQVPPGAVRDSFPPDHFGHFLQELPLKAHGSPVHYYNGGEKPNYGVYDAVIDLPIGNKDLHQCADAVMRLRADYLYSQGRYQDIHFHFTNGFDVHYSEWRKGKRMVVQGNRTYWRQTSRASTSSESYWQYLELIFMYAGTLSLSKEMRAISVAELEIGDVFVQGGSPGHAVIVVDVARNPSTGKRFFLLAQSYMPAQELQLLKNPSNSDLSPWYEADFGEVLETPEWRFYARDLKRWE